MPAISLIISGCEFAASIARQLEERGIAGGNMLQIGSQQDLAALIDANLGIAFLPAGAPRHKHLACLAVSGLETRRKISLYTVAGRPRSPAADALIKLLRARKWSLQAR
jgi:DNA-binding transcriptional LysR family regulator